MINIHFHKSLQKYTGIKEHKLEISTYSNLKEALLSLFPKLRALINFIDNGGDINKYITLSYNKKDLVPDSWVIKNTIADDITDLWILPGISGGGGGNNTTNILIGIAFIALAVVTAGIAAPAGAGLLAGLSTTGLLGGVARMALGIGINLVLGALFSKNLKKPSDTGKTSDENQRKNNDLFEGLINTINTNTPVQLNYGLIRVPGHFISGYIDTVEHGKADIINVKTTYFS